MRSPLGLSIMLSTGVTSSTSIPCRQQDLGVQYHTWSEGYIQGLSLHPIQRIGAKGETTWELLVSIRIECFISVEFDYQQKRLFNIECKTEPLVDAINDGCYADIAALLKKQKYYFTNELNQMKKKKNAISKKHMPFQTPVFPFLSWE